MVYMCCVAAARSMLPAYTPPSISACSNANMARVCWGVGPVGSFLVLKPKFWLFLSDSMLTQNAESEHD